MIVSQLMTTDVLTVTPETSLKDVAAILSEHRISGLPVVADGAVVGVVSEADILLKERAAPEEQHGVLAKLRLRHVDDPKLHARTAGEAMTSPAVTVGPRKRVHEAARLMTDRGINRLPVVARDTLVGIVTRADLVRAFTRSDEQIEREIRDDVIARTFWMASHDVDVTVTGGAVKLFGTVDTRTVSELLPRFVQSVPGVLEVEADLAWRIDDRAHDVAAI
jgi:CBS domain-containing protein